MSRLLSLPACAHELADVVVDRVVALHIAARDNRCDEHLDIDERAVLARPACDDAHVALLTSLLVEFGSLGADFGRVCDEFVDVAADCLLPAVSEELFGRRVPRGDRVDEIERSDRGRTVLQERL